MLGLGRERGWGAHTENWKETGGGDVIADIGRRNGTTKVEAGVGRGGKRGGVLNRSIHPKPIDSTNSPVWSSISIVWCWFNNYPT